jgi:hypothetical protein
MSIENISNNEETKALSQDAVSGSFYREIMVSKEITFKFEFM